MSKELQLFQARMLTLRIDAWQTVLMFWAVMSIAFLVNVFGAKYLDLINKVCIYWTGASVIIIVVTILVMSDERRNAEFVFAHFDASASGWVCCCYPDT